MPKPAAKTQQRRVNGNVAIYLRVSTEEQPERQSIDTQREFGAKYRDLIAGVPARGFPGLAVIRRSQ
jgi:hypothetical protein